MKSYKLKLSLLALFISIGSMTGIDAACIHDSEAENNGNCKADATLNPNGTWTINGYNCETSKPAPGYPHFYNCVIGEGLADTL